MLAATTSPWYLPTWVSGQMPVTSPIAQRLSPARRCASTLMPWSSNSTATVSRPTSATRGAGPSRRGCGRRAARGRRRTSGRSPRRRARPVACTPRTSSACTRPARGATATTTSLTSTSGRECAATASRRDRPSAPRRRRWSRDSCRRIGRPRHQGRRTPERRRDLWAVGDVTGIWPLTTSASTRATSPQPTYLRRAARGAWMTRCHRVYTDPQAAAVGAAEARLAGARIASVAKQHTRARTPKAGS